MHITIPLAARTKKNSSRIVRGRLISSKAYMEFREAAAWYIKRPKAPIDYPVTVRCIFWMDTHRRVDKLNLEAGIHDLLVECGVLADDNRDIVASTDGTRVYYDKAHPRVEIDIEPFTEEYEVWKHAD